MAKTLDEQINETRARAALALQTGDLRFFVEQAEALCDGSEARGVVEAIRQAKAHIDKLEADHEMALQLIGSMHNVINRLRDQRDALARKNQSAQRRVDNAYSQGFDDGLKAAQDALSTDGFEDGDPLDDEPTTPDAWLAWHDALSEANRQRWRDRLDAANRESYDQWYAGRKQQTA